MKFKQETNTSSIMQLSGETLQTKAVFTVEMQIRVTINMKIY